MGTEDDEKMETDEDDEEAAALKAALAMSMQDEGEKPLPVGPGLPAEFQGQYELFAVVTHKGRDADGGHYMAWVKAKSNSGKVGRVRSQLAGIVIVRKGVKVCNIGAH